MGFAELLAAIAKLKTPLTTDTLVRLCLQYVPSTAFLTSADGIKLCDLAKTTSDLKGRGPAIEQVRALFMGASALAFKHANRKELAYQLLLRVLEPRLVNQGKAGLCGPVAVTVAHAKSHPESYAKIVRALAEQGKADLPIGRLEPIPELCAFDPSKHGIPIVDWIFLTSLRNHKHDAKNIGLLAGGGGDLKLADFGRSKSPLRYDWFTRLGFRDVMHLPVKTKNKPVTPSFNRPELAKHPEVSANSWDAWTNLGIAQRLLARKQGWHVEMSIDSKILKQAPGLADFDAMIFQSLSSTVTNHSVLVRRIEIYKGGDATHLLNLTLYSWGAKWELKGLSLPAFLNVYHGFIGASDLDNGKPLPAANVLNLPAPDAKDAKKAATPGTAAAAAAGGSAAAQPPPRPFPVTTAAGPPSNPFGYGTAKH